MLTSDLVIFYIVVVLTTSRRTVEAEELSPPVSEFTRYSVVQPLLLHGRTKREISSTRDTNGAHHVEVTIKVPIEGEDYILDLRLNQGLVTDNHVLSYQENGKTVLHKPKKEEMDLCYYSGSVRDKPDSWVAVSSCRGVQGIMHDGKKMRYIEPAQGDINGKHYIYDHSDLSELHLDWYYRFTNSSQNNLQKSGKNRYKRQAPNEEQIRGPFQATERSLYVELVLVVDNRHFRAHRNDIHSVHREMKTLANLINAVYSTLNIYIALVGVVIWNDYDEISLSNQDSLTILNNFMLYRQNKLATKILNDNAFLITEQKFDGSVVGKARIGTICTHDSSGGIANAHTKVIGQLAMTIAHELGHNFGMDHDEEGNNCECEQKKCIMSSTSTSYIPYGWSACSLSSLALTFSRGLDYCLRNKPKSLLDSPTCGNSFVEPGEQCDCGTMAAAGTYNPCHACCDPNTCMLRANATCGTGICCDLQTCRPKSIGTICRSSDRECDLPEYCTGQSEYCPEDVYKMDTTPCGIGEQSAYCVDGRCRSQLDQCRMLWGPTGKACPEKAQLTLQPKYGDCGFDRIRGTPKSCTAPNLMCGRLMCTHLSGSSYSTLEIGSMPSNKVKMYQWGTHDMVVTCDSAYVDLGLSVVDFGLVPDGAKCGDGKMCLKQQCVSVSAVRDRIASAHSSVCPSNCSGNGVCNSAGHCHCDLGFAPPLCAGPGAGGSYDSGPVTDENVLKIFMIVMYGIFLGIVPMVALILLIIYCTRNNGFSWCMQHKWKISFKSSQIVSSTKNMAGPESPMNSKAEDNPTTTLFTKNTETTIAFNPSPIYGNIEELRSKKTPHKVANVNKNQEKLPSTIVRSTKNMAGPESPMKGNTEDNLTTLFTKNTETTTAFNPSPIYSNIEELRSKKTPHKVTNVNKNQEKLPSTIVRSTKHMAGPESPMKDNTEDNPTTTLLAKNTETTTAFNPSPIYGNIEELRSKKTPFKVANVNKNQERLPSTRHFKTKTKNDIQVVDLSNVKLKPQPPVKPKPYLEQNSSNNRLNIVHVKGLNSNK